MALLCTLDSLEEEMNLQDVGIVRTVVAKLIEDGSWQQKSILLWLISFRSNGT